MSQIYCPTIQEVIHRDECGECEMCPDYPVEWLKDMI